MRKLSDKKIKKLIWLISIVICCLLSYFACLPIYRTLIETGGSREVIGIVITFLSSISLIYISFFPPYVMALFLIDCSKLSQQTLLKSKITGIFTIISVLTMLFSSIFNYDKLGGNAFFGIYHQSVILLIFPITIVLLSRFWLQKMKKYPILLGMASLSVFYIFSFTHLSKMEIMEGMAWVFFIFFVGIVVCLVSIIINVNELKNIRAISGRTIK